jgi:NAD(P)H-hydrate epimerase
MLDMLPEALYTAAQVRHLDRRAIEGHGIPAATLMARAGAAAFAVLRARHPRARRIAVACGPGNNGGDGYVAARLAREAGLEVRVGVVGALPRPESEAGAARAACVQSGVAVAPFDPTLPASAEVVVDALLGTGLARDVEGAFRAAIEAINASGRPVLALDIPSGLDADTGAVRGVAVRAAETVTFVGLKTGLFTAHGRAFSGEILFDDLGVPPAVYDGLAPTARRLTEAGLCGTLHPRPADAHKGTFGHVLVIGGGPGMPGAARLAGQAASRAGAGLVTLAVHPSSHAACAAACAPELLVFGVAAPGELAPLAARADVIALGPGLGQDAWAQALFQAALRAGKPLVVDADALNLLAREPLRAEDWILTPHPGEAGRLLGIGAERVQADRFAAVRALAQSYGGVCVLKGSGTLVAEDGDETVDLCDRGNPGMASGGMGDVLTGIIAALRAQGLAARAAARLGVWLHATAADEAAAAGGGEIGLVASDLFGSLRRVLNRLARRRGGDENR